MPACAGMTMKDGIVDFFSSLLSLANGIQELADFPFQGLGAVLQ